MTTGPSVTTARAHAGVDEACVAGSGRVPGKRTLTGRLPAQHAHAIERAATARTAGAHADPAFAADVVTSLIGPPPHALDKKAKALAPYFDEIHRVADEVTGLFESLGLRFRPAILFAIVLQEADARDPLTTRSFDNGLGLTQITPTHGKLDPEVARAIGWDNAQDLEHNVAHSHWRDAYANLRAGAANLALKAKRIRRRLPARWSEMTEAQRWRACLYAYNAGEGSAIAALRAGGGDAPMISRFRDRKGRVVSHDYTEEIEDKLAYASEHEAFAR